MLTKEAYLLFKIDSALKANNMSNDIEWKKEFCQCDASVGQVPCPYCEIHDALSACKNFISDKHQIFVA